MVKKNLKKSKKLKEICSGYQASESEIKADFRKLKIKLEDAPEKDESRKEINDEKKRGIAVEMLAQLQSLQPPKKKERGEKKVVKNKEKVSPNVGSSFSHIRYQFPLYEFQNYFSNMVYTANLPFFPYYQNLSNLYY